MKEQQSFDDNEDELFQFLGQECLSKDTGKRSSHSLYWTVSLALEMVRTQTKVNRACPHEEADTRMLRHVKDSMNCSFKSAMITTVDADDVVLPVAHLQGLPNIEQLWVAFGTVRDFRYITIHEIPYALCPQVYSKHT